MKFLGIGLVILLLVAYTRKTDFGNPPSVALWCVVMLLAWAAVIYGGVAYALVR